MPGGDHEIGSPEDEAGRDVYSRFRQKCEEVNVEARRRVSKAKALAPVQDDLERALALGWKGQARLFLKAFEQFQRAWPLGEAQIGLVRLRYWLREAVSAYRAEAPSAGGQLFSSRIACISDGAFGEGRGGHDQSQVFLRTVQGRVVRRLAEAEADRRAHRHS